MGKHLAAIVVLASLLAMVLPAHAQDAPLPGTLFVWPEPVTIGATVPCDSARYTMAEVAPESEGKAYTARAFGGTACTTSLDFVAPQAFAATSPITVHVVLGCDSPSGSAGVAGATASVRFNILHDGTQVGPSINLVGSNTCTSAPLVYQANADLGGEEFAAGDTLTVNVIPFYTTGGAGDPNKNLHVKTGGADPSVVVVPDLAGGSGGAGGAPPTLFQNVSTPELRTGRNSTTNLTQTEVYNWTASEPSLLTYSAEVLGGSVHIVVTDASNATQVNQTVNATGNNSMAIGTGNLTLRLEYVNYTGSLVITMAPAPPATSSSSSASSTPAAPNDDTRTGTFPLRHTNDTPGVSLPLAFLGLAAAVLVVRRRLA